MNLGNYKMPKDRVLSTKTFVLSHLTLLIIALVFFAGLYYILYPEKFKEAVPQYNPVTKEPVSLFLELTSPEDDILSNDASVVISGRTSPNATVIISSNDNDSGLESGNDGQFSKVFPLSDGPNIIEITAIDSEGNSKSVTKSIFFTEEKI